MRAIAFACALLAATAASSAAEAGDVPGFATRAIDVGEGRSVDVALWYPAEDGGTPVSIGAGPVFKGVAAMEGAPIADGPFPLVLIAHGGLRSAPHQANWLGAALAADGFVAAIVRGPALGPADAAMATDEIGRRPNDLRAALDALIADPAWKGRIDGDAVGAVVFFLGGTSALMLAGAEIDPVRYAASCDAPDGGPDCRWFEASGIDLHHADATALAGSHGDPRIGAVVAIDAELVDSLSPDSLAAIDTDVTLINLGDDPGAGSGLAEAIPGADAVTIAGASHVSAFAICTPKGPAILAEEGEDAALCREEGGGDRADVHEAISRAVIAALTAALKDQP